MLAFIGKLYQDLDCLRGSPVQQCCLSRCCCGYWPLMAPLYGVTGSPGDACLVQLYWVLDGCDSGGMGSTFYFFFQFLYSTFLGEMKNIS